MLLTFPFLYITEGIPDPENLKSRLNQDGFQNIIFVQRENALKNESPCSYGRRFLTHMPENAMALSYTVACGRRILDIPSSLEEARAMLDMLSGRRHQVWVNFGFRTQNKIYSRGSVTRVSFKRLTQEERETCLYSGEWRGRVGGYDAFGRAAAFIKSINGSPTALLGLPEFEWLSFLQSRILK